MATLFLAAAIVLPDSRIADGLGCLAFTYISIDILLHARVGYLRRRPHWTRASWHRYLAVCAVPIGALLVLAGMMLAFELGLPVVGEVGTPARALWVSGMLVAMLVGAAGLLTVILCLIQGEPSRQFSWSRSRRHPSSET